MTNEEKKQIQTDLRTYVDTVAGGSSNKASKMLQKVSVAYVSNMLNGKWESISDDAWRNIKKQVSREGWVYVETQVSKTLNLLCDDAKKHANVFAIINDPGTGKTFTASRYSEMHENVYLVKCNEYYNRRSFLSELLRVMGKDAGGYNVSDMMGYIIQSVLQKEEPIFILDESDKLNDQVFYFFITMYNALEGKCGIILTATDYLEKRVEKGLKLNRKGFKEIYSRIGRRFIHLPKIKKADAVSVMRANGMTDELEQQNIWNQCEGDLRRVKRLVHAALKREVANA